ncbi:GNAT family N-acetyltransferase [Streptomyces sp. CJ_13]|uniref:GNAT family N-acetyltransferase n=1 Tax=Streptomyces TaxID=1883 RepID=UPI000F3A9117|nr:MULTISPECIES: GNAT family protein [unclassified Streptomyces]AYV27977.1 Putative ribosomal N-acetyltransferase YdaF [Streptomyces sp. ADI95-16]MBT1186447.1 GNAT family N-acetyltransferase [Streptomyces sp. CJ_13]
MIIDGVEMRGVTFDDAAGLADVLLRNRAYMAPYEPYRSEEFYTGAGQRARLEEQFAERDGGRLLPFVLVEAATGDPVGTINLGSIALGPLRSGGVGYWVDREWTGKGLATAALEEVCRIARDELGLHRVEAGTLVDNTASQRVLAKAGFSEYGLAPRFLHINGAWRDHRLFQRLLHDDPPPR